MFHTPSKIETRRSKARREKEERKLLEDEQRMSHSGEKSEVPNSEDPLSLPRANKFLANTNKVEGSVKSEPTASGFHDKKPPVSSVTRASSSRGSRMSSASKEARKKQLLLEAAKQKAAIQMEIIDKTLDAQLASLSDEEDKQSYSSQVDRRDLSQVAEWVEHQSNHREPQADQHQTPKNELETGELPQHVPQLTPVPGTAPRAATPAPAPAPVPAAPLPPPDGTVTALNSAIHVLAEAVKNISTANVNSTPNTSLLSRLSTPKDLPDFSGDYLEWLQFKQAYYESTEVCQFTDKENLWRLRKCLRGAAKDAVNALFISATSPEKVMSALELRYGNSDCIISRILYDIKKLPPLHHDYHKDIITFALKVQNYVEAVRALGQEEYLQGVNIVSIILSKLPTVLISKWSDYSFNLIKEGKKARLVIMSDFLNDEAVKISTTASMYTATRHEVYKHKPVDTNNARTHTILVHAEGSDKKCLFCHTSVHKLTECKSFKRALRKVRWQFVRKNGLCYKCLLSKHERESCRAPACDKDGCGESHHRLLHYTVNKIEVPVTSSSSGPSNSSSTSATNALVQHEPEPGSIPETLTHINASDKKVLLKVVPVCVQGPNGTVNTTALLDDGSSVSLISANLARRVGLHGHSETLRVRGAFGDNELVCKSTIVNVDLKGMDNKVYNVKMRCVDELSLPLQTLSVLKLVNYAYLTDIKHNLCTTDSIPELLIGQDNHHLLLPIQLKVGKSNEPFATLSPLGWSVHGKVCVPRTVRPSARCPPANVHTNLFIADSSMEHDTTNEYLLREIHEDVRRSFLLDSIGVSTQARQNAEDVRAVALLERSAKLIDGRWHVGLPWRDEHCTMPDSYPTALNRMKGIERRMAKDSGFAERYRERVRHLFQNDYAQELLDTQVRPKTFYLAHFGVDNPNKQRLRLVFDSANKVNGFCLNDYLLTGPDLLSSLFGIMLRFRENKIGVTGDIKDMFLRVKIRAEDQHALRFLWRDNPSDELKTYVMSSLIFGANCSPFVAQFVKNLNARRFESSMPEAVNAVCSSHYVDDYIDSFPDEATAIKMVSDISSIHSAGGFEIRNWTSNSIAVLNSVPKDTLGTAAVRFKIDQQHLGERTLGLIWYPADDMLAFDVSLKRIPESIISGDERPTKRLMLKVIMSIFDVLGFLAPFTIQGRIMLQDTWRLSIGWDDYIPDHIYNKWRKWIDLLKVINKLRIPRYYSSAARNREQYSQPEAPCASKMQDCPGSNSPPAPDAATHGATRCYDSAAASTCATVRSVNNNYNNLQLHLFCDSSSQAMSAVGYWRWNDKGIIHVAFIASKCRVMPVKPLTIPKAELQAGVLAARLANAIVNEHKLTPLRRYFWCDSTTVIHWIRNKNRTYKTFEANRLGEIDELTRVDEWRYVSTKLNVADLATRESFDLTLQDEWFKGPSFLYDDESLWPSDVILTGNEADSIDCVAVVQGHVEPACLPVPDPHRFSSWLRLTRATAAVLKFIARCKGQAAEIDCSLMERAEVLLLKHAQLESFGEEIARIQKRVALHRSSRLLNLSPFLDEQGLLRVGGRIDAAKDVALDVKRPVILDGRHPVARIIIRHFHVKAAHGSQETIVNEIKQRVNVLRWEGGLRSFRGPTSSALLRRYLSYEALVGERQASGKRQARGRHAAASRAPRGIVNMNDKEREERDAAACAALLNNTVPPPGLHCPGTFDTWACWPPTPAGSVVRAPCPGFVPGFSTDLLAHKECTINGTWWSHPNTGKPWSNYTPCVKPEDDMSDIIAVYEAGYSVSLVALLLSLAILFYFRSLRCARITVHMNLFASFAINNALWLLWYELVVGSPSTLADSPAWCRALNVALQYALLTNYTWMLCEGLYLHTVLVAAFISERRLLRALLGLGWLLPLPSAIIYAARRAAADDPMCWNDEGAPPIELTVLVSVAVLLNLGFLCNIVRVLCTKLRAGGGAGGAAAGAAQPTATALHALRATCLLAPLLGLQYLLMPYKPDPSASWWRLYEYVSALSSSLQGLCVAILYCFCNGEVLAQLRRRWRVLTFRPRANSTTNTTVSFVRSAAPGAGEDKV